ncbi:MAG: hypothetical protein JNJ57_22155 [Saprospiraceae bacterium]|nr:hypothetical protein [Saprospiraceae bacterium]
MSILDDNSSISNASGGLKPTGEMKRNWVISSKWAQFLSILGFVQIAISILMIGAFGTILQMMSMYMGDNPMTAFFGMISTYYYLITLLSVAFMFFIHFFHLRFSLKIKQAVNQNDQHAFTGAWQNLRNHFRIFGIAVCIVLVFYIGIFIFALTAAASAGGSIPLE